MRLGRPNTIVDMNKRHLTKGEIEERRRRERASKVGRENLKPLPLLNEVGAAEFERIKELAYWLDDLDKTDLNLYCFYYSRIVAVMAEYDGCDEIVEMDDGKMIANPLRKAMKDYHGEMRRLSLKLGIAQLDRLRVAAPVKEEETNKYAAFFK